MDRERIREALVDAAFKPDAGWRRDGRRFGWLLDCREILLDRRYLPACGRLLWSLARPHRPDAVAGAVLSGVPLVAGVLCAAGAEDPVRNGYIIRAAAKPYGLRKQIEGPALVPGERVVILDDLASSGATIARLAGVLRQAGAEVCAAVVMIDFQRGAESRLHSAGIVLASVFTLSGLGIERARDSSPAAASRYSWAYGPGNVHPVTAPHSSPLAYRDMFIAGTDTGCVVALDAAGAARWRTDLDGGAGTSVHSSPAVRAGRIYVGSDDGFLNCLRIEDGCLAWRRRCGTCVGSSPVAGQSANGPVFVGAADGEHAGSLVAMDAITGEVIWRRPLTGYAHASPALDESRSVAVAADNNGIVRAFDSMTGHLRWEYDAAAAVKGRLLADELGQVYFGSFDGFCHAIDTETGAVRWKRKIGDRVYCSPCLAGDAVIMATSTHAVCLSGPSGRIRWWSATNSRVRGGAVAVDGAHVALGCGDGRIWLLAVQTGEPVQSLVAEGPILSSVAVTPGLIVASCANGMVYGFRRSRDAFRAVDSLQVTGLASKHITQCFHLSACHFTQRNNSSVKGKVSERTLVA